MPRTPSVPCVLEPAEVIGQPTDLAALTCEDCELVPLPSPTETYHMLSIGTCQCSAATNAPQANMVELERHWARVVIECDTKAVGKNYRLERDLLALRANEIRNEAASSALEAFYQLAGLEAQKHFLQLATDETERTLDRINKSQEQGNHEFPTASTTAPIESRLHELKDQQLTARVPTHSTQRTTAESSSAAHSTKTSSIGRRSSGSWTPSRSTSKPLWP